MRSGLGERNDCILHTLYQLALALCVLCFSLCARIIRTPLLLHDIMRHSLYQRLLEKYSFKFRCFVHAFLSTHAGLDFEISCDYL